MIILDTHAWLWWAADGDKLPRTLQRRLQRERTLAICAISCWEIGMLVQRRRLTLRGEPRVAIRDLLALDGLQVESVSDAIATEAGHLPETFHGDLADRLIVATALVPTV